MDNSLNVSLFNGIAKAEKWNERCERLIGECGEQGWNVGCYHLAVGARGFIERKRVALFKKKICIFEQGAKKVIIKKIQEAVDKAIFYTWLK